MKQGESAKKVKKPLLGMVKVKSTVESFFKSKIKILKSKYPISI